MPLRSRARATGAAGNCWVETSWFPPSGVESGLAPPLAASAGAVLPVKGEKSGLELSQGAVGADATPPPGLVA